MPTSANYPNIKPVYNLLLQIKIRFISATALSGAAIFLYSQAAVLLLCGAVTSAIQFQFTGFIFLGLSIFLALFVLIKHIAMPLRDINNESFAKRLEAGNKSLDNRLINAIQLSDPKYIYNTLFSKDMITALIDDTNRGLKKGLKYDDVLSFKRSGIEISKLLVISLLFFLANHFSPDAINNAFSAIVHPAAYFNKLSSKPIFTKPVLKYPEIGDIDLTYILPSYTKSPPVNIKNTSGDINVLKGSEVIIKAKSNVALKSAAIKINDQTIIPMTLEGGNQLTGRFAVLENGFYYIEAKDTGGLTNKNPIKHNIQITEDEFPSLSLIYPDDMIEVKFTDKIELSYRYRDDFGINRLEVVYKAEDKNGGKISDGRTKINHPDETSYEGKYMWNMALLKLKEGGEITYYLEAYDNDTISGSKKVKTPDTHIKIYDNEEGHNELIFKQEKLLDAMLSILADELENPFDRKVNSPFFVKMKDIDKDIGNLLTNIELVVKSLEDDPLSDPATGPAYKKIAERLFEINREKRDQIGWIHDNADQFIDDTAASLVINAVNREITEIESDIILTDNLIKREKVNTLYKQEDDLLDAQESLRDLLSNLSNMNKDEAVKKLNEALKRIEDMYKEFVEKLFSMSKELPDEFVNSDAFKHMDDKKTTDMMQAIKDALKNNDLNKASKLAEDLMSQMESLLNNLMSEAEDMAYDTSGDIDKLGELADGASELLEKEGKLMNETEKVDKAQQKAMQDMLKDRLDKFKEKIAGLTSILNKKIRDVKERTRDNIGMNSLVNNSLFNIEQDIASMLSSLNKDILQAEAASAEITNKLRSLSARLNMLRGGEKEAVMPKANEALSASEAIEAEFKNFLKKRDEMDEATLREMLEMSKVQRDLMKKGELLKKGLEGIEGAELLWGDQGFKDMDDALAGMESADNGLKGGNIPSSLSGEKDAVNGLTKFKDGLKKIQSELQGMKGGGKKIRMGMNPTKIEGSGSMGKIHGKVDVPEKGEENASRMLREEILRAMQGNTPSKYKDMNNQYYKELMR